MKLYDIHGQGQSKKVKQDVKTTYHDVNRSRALKIFLRQTPPNSRIAHSAKKSIVFHKI